MKPLLKPIRAAMLFVVLIGSAYSTYLDFGPGHPQHSPTSEAISLPTDHQDKDSPTTEASQSPQVPHPPAKISILMDWTLNRVLTLHAAFGDSGQGREIAALFAERASAMSEPDSGKLWLAKYNALRTTDPDGLRLIREGRDRLPNTPEYTQDRELLLQLQPITPLGDSELEALSNHVISAPDLPSLRASLSAYLAAEVDKTRRRDNLSRALEHQRTPEERHEILRQLGSVDAVSAEIMMQESETQPDS